MSLGPPVPGAHRREVVARRAGSPDLSDVTVDVDCRSPPTPAARRLRGPSAWRPEESPPCFISERPDLKEVDFRVATLDPAIASRCVPRRLLAVPHLRSAVGGRCRNLMGVRARRGLRIRWRVLTTAMVAIVASAALVAPADGLAQADQFELVGTHPQASQQPTVRGRTLNFLKHWNGAIYAGYGDYGANTGPIAITPFALSTGQFAAQPAFSANTEELQVFRALNGNLYAPSIDPRPGFGDDYFETPLTGPWTGRDVVGIASCLRHGRANGKRTLDSRVRRRQRGRMAQPGRWRHVEHCPDRAAQEQRRWRLCPLLLCRRLSERALRAGCRLQRRQASDIQGL